MFYGDIIDLISSFQNFYAGFIKKLKSEGRGDTEHRKEIPTSSLKVIMDLLRLLQEILRCEDKKTPEYRNLIEKLPKDYQDSYHILIQKGVVYLLISLFGRRARENTDALTKAHFEKMYDEEENYFYWGKAVGEKTKNYQ